MTKVTFTHKNGRQEVMDERFARILGGLKRGTYLTRDMQSVPVAAPPVSQVPPASSEQVEPASDAGAEPKAKRKYTRKAKE